MLKGEGYGGNVQGIEVLSPAPKINHLLFADDSILFFKPTANNANVVQQVLT
jgi:hypothetical protein